MTEDIWSEWSITYNNSIGYDKDYNTLHLHPFDEISLIIQGDIKYISDTSNARIGNKSLIFSKAYQMHNPYVNQNGRYERYQINFMHKWLDDSITTNYEYNFDSFTSFLSDRDYNEILQYMMLFYADKDKENELVILKRKHLLSALFSKVIDVYNSSPHSCNQITKTYINDVLSYIDENYSQRLIAEEIASSFYVSRTKLFYDFKKHTGMTLLDYITLNKLKHAKEMLKKGYSVTDTSSLCGFSDSGYFIKKFSAFNKITPLKYQQLINKQKKHI